MRRGKKHRQRGEQVMLMMTQPAPSDESSDVSAHGGQRSFHTKTHLCCQSHLHTANLHCQYLASTLAASPPVVSNPEATPAAASRTLRNSQGRLPHCARSEACSHCPPNANTCNHPAAGKEDAIPCSTAMSGAAAPRPARLLRPIHSKGLQA